MQRIRLTLLYGTIVAAAAVLFFCLFLEVNAGYITGSEGSFTHTHGDACYTEVTASCSDRHTSQKMYESGFYRCDACNALMEQWIIYDLYKCPVQGVSWQKNAHINCKICGTEHSHWNDSTPGVHIYTEKRLDCGIEDGETTATLTVSADDAWTNRGVTLTAHINELKQDLTYGSISCSWEGGTLYVTENGTYSVTATDAAGRSITAAIEVNCIDKNAPVIKSVNANTDKMSKTSIYVNVSAEDNESGLDAQAYSTDGGLTWSSSSGFLLEEGKNIQLAVRDRAGNIATRSLARSAFPYPPEPSPSPAPSSPSPAVSAELSKQTSAGTPGLSSSASGSVFASSGKAAQSSFDAAAENGTGKTSHRSKDNASSLHKSGLTETADTSDEDESGTGSSALADADETEEAGATDKTDVLLASETGGQNQERVRKNRGEGVLKLKNAAFSLTESSLGDGRAERITDRAKMFLSAITGYIHTHLQSLLGTGLLAAAALLLFRLLWLHSAELYCYNGGEEYRRVGLLHLKRKKQEFELYLPEYMLETRGTPRYRLMFKKKLIKRHEGVDLVVRGEDYKLRQPLEECVDFVL